MRLKQTWKKYNIFKNIFDFFNINYTYNTVWSSSDIIGRSDVWHKSNWTFDSIKTPLKIPFKIVFHKYGEHAAGIHCEIIGPASRKPESALKIILFLKLKPIWISLTYKGFIGAMVSYKGFSGIIKGKIGHRQYCPLNVKFLYGPICCWIETHWS